MVRQRENLGLALLRGRDDVKEEDNVISSLLSSTRFIPTQATFAALPSLHERRGFAYDGRRLFSPCGKKRRGKKRGLFFPRKQKVETKFPMNDVSLGHRRLILRPTPAAAGRAGRPGPLITVPQRLHVEKLLPGMGAQAFVEEQAPPFRSEDKRRIEKRCSRRGHSSCRGLRPKRRVVGGK